MLSIKSQLQHQLWQAISNVNGLPTATQFTPQPLPLRRFCTGHNVDYRCAIALQLSKPWQQSPVRIAQELTLAWQRRSQASREPIPIKFEVEVLPEGWLKFPLSDRALATWLQGLIDTPPVLYSPDNNLNPNIQEKRETKNCQIRDNHSQDTDSIFPLQYIHARCCSLLRLANEQGLIQVRNQPSMEIYHGRNENDQHPSFQSPMTIISPYPIPWLKETGDLKHTSVHLRFTHQDEWDLMIQLLDLSDVMSTSDAQRWIKQGLALAEAFEQFDRNCRILANVKHQNLPLAQTRLGLIGVTQVLLRSLLQEHFSISAPRTL